MSVAEWWWWLIDYIKICVILSQHHCQDDNPQIYGGALGDPVALTDSSKISIGLLDENKNSSSCQYQKSVHQHNCTKHYPNRQPDFAGPCRAVLLSPVHLGLIKWIALYPRMPQSIYHLQWKDTLVYTQEELNRLLLLFCGSGVVRQIYVHTNVMEIAFLIDMVYFYQILAYVDIVWTHFSFMF